MKKPKPASLGPSAVALAARIGRPGGTHGRRKPPRTAAKQRAINESKEA